MKKIIFLFIFASMCLLGDVPPKIPESDEVYLYSTWDEVPVYSAIFDDLSLKIFIPHGYIHLGQHCGANDLEEFMKRVRGGYGFFVVGAHGLPEGWMEIERLGISESEANERLRKLKKEFKFFGKDATHEEIRWSMKDGKYSIIISPLFLQRRTSMPNSIVFLDGCHSENFIGALKGVGCCFGWNDVTQGFDINDGPVNIFYRTGGKNYAFWEGGEVQPQGDLRNKTVGEAMSEYPNPRLVMSGNSDMKLYNSPRIVGALITQSAGDKTTTIYSFGVFDGKSGYPYYWDYPSGVESAKKEPATPGKRLVINILFSSFMDEEIDVKIKPEGKEETFDVVGSWIGGIEFDRDIWQGRVESWEADPGLVTLLVDAKDDFEGDINEKLDTDGDGNSDGSASLMRSLRAEGKDENHEFEVTDLPIVVYADPSENERDVLVDKDSITVIFSQSMEQTATQEAVSIVSDNGDEISFTPSWKDTVTLELLLSDTLDYCMEYTCTVTDSAINEDSVKLDGNEDGTAGGNYIFKFTTESPELTVEGFPVVAHVEEGQSRTHNVFTKGDKLKADVNCNITFEVNNPGGWMVSGANDENFPLSPDGEHKNTYNSTNTGATASLNVSYKVGAECGSSGGESYCWSSEGHMADHPDENQSPGKMEYPTPWITRTQSLSPKTSSLRGDSVLPEGLPDIGILLSGWSDGYGHILGKYGISTLPVKPDLKILNNEDINISDSVKLLVIGSAGLKGFNSQEFK